MFSTPWERNARPLYLLVLGEYVESHDAWDTSRLMFISASQGLEIMFFFIFSFFFHFDHHFFGLKIIISFLSPLSFFIIFSFLFFLPLAFSFFFPLLRKWSLVLGNCHQRLFLEPFSFFFIVFLFFLRFGIFSFLCL